MESLLREGVGEGPLSHRDFRRYDSPISQVRKQENFLPGVIQLGAVKPGSSEDVP